jgi:hypothetical protein
MAAEGKIRLGNFAKYRDSTFSIFLCHFLRDKKLPVELNNKIFELHKHNFLVGNWTKTDETLCNRAATLISLHQFSELILSKTPAVKSIYAEFSTPDKITVSESFSQKVLGLSVNVLMRYLQAMHYWYNFVNRRTGETYLLMFIKNKLTGFESRITTMKVVYKFLHPQYYANMYDLLMAGQRLTRDLVFEKSDTARQKSWFYRAIMLNAEFPAHSYGSKMMQIVIRFSAFYNFSPDFLAYVKTLPEHPTQLSSTEYSRDYMEMLKKSTPKNNQVFIVLFDGVVRLIRISGSSWVTALFKNNAIKGSCFEHNLRRDIIEFFSRFKNTPSWEWVLDSDGIETDKAYQSCAVANVCRLSYQNNNYIDVDAMLNFVREKLRKMANKEASLEAVAVKAMRCSHDYTVFMHKHFLVEPVKPSPCDPQIPGKRVSASRFGRAASTKKKTNAMKTHSN